MHDDDAARANVDEQSARRERIVRDVLSRIASAPAPARVPRETGVFDGIVAWTRPALAAAALIMMASTLSLIWATRSGRGSERVSDALGLTSPLARFVSTGEVDTWGWLSGNGSPP